MRSFSLEVNGNRFTGTWQVRGEMVEIRSDYGSTRVRLDGRDPGQVAREALASLVSYKLVRA